MTSLVIVESPAKCSKIAGFLGAGYKVIASMGHIRTLEEQLEAVGIDRDFEPRLRFMTKEKGSAIAAIKTAAAAAQEVILAADDDREGEAIAASIAALLRLDPRTTKRAVFHEITKPAVTRAIANTRLLDMDKVHAQQARAQLDMLIGFTMSPLLWRHVGRGLSAGRCQTPALRFVVEREEEIGAHVGSVGWAITGKWVTGNKQSIDAALIDELEDEESAQNYMEQIGANAAIVAVSQRPWSESAPLPLITSSLQQVASTLFRSNPKNTMKVAQRLYEAGHITYMRTDKAVLGEEAQAEARALVADQFGQDYLGHGVPTSKSSGKKAQAQAGGPPTQEAHEAIRPTHFEIPTLVGAEWTPLDIKIYQLIRIRAIQSVMAPVQGQAATVRFQTADDEAGDLLWSANARITTFQGWRIASATSTMPESDAEEETANAWTTLTTLKVGDTLTWKTLEAVPRLTKPAARYSEASLISTLEKHGIGRPSTFASLLAAIEDKGYVEKKNIEGKKVTLNRLTVSAGGRLNRQTIERSIGGERDRLVPTTLGRQALAFTLQHFSDLFAYEFTAGMEARLDAIAEGKEPWKAVLRDTWATYKDRYESLNEASNPSTAKQRDFGSGLKAVLTRKGPMLLREAEGKGKAIFYNWPAGVEFEALTAEQATAAAQGPAPIGTYEGQPMIKHDGKFGPYVTAGDLKVSWTPEDTEETLKAKFEALAATKVGPFTFKVGKFGPYMYKTALQTKKFVSVPATVNPATLTVREADEIYRQGLAEAEAKAKTRAAWAAKKSARN
jgi:DNA topoisomerase-1